MTRANLNVCPSMTGVILIEGQKLSPGVVLCYIKQVSAGMDPSGTESHVEGKAGAVQVGGLGSVTLLGVQGQV